MSELERCVTMVMGAGFATGHADSHTELMAEVLWQAGAMRQHREALERIAAWAEAYPLDIFPEPDLKRAHEVLKAGGMSLGGISAEAMRHSLKRVGQIAREALGNESR